MLAPMSTPQPEVWQRGPVEGFDPLVMPVVHAFVQVQEDLRALSGAVPPGHVWARPGGAASIAFHVRHIAGATDRLLTYARGETLNDAQKAAMRGEGDDAEPRPDLSAMVEATVASLDLALAQVKSTTSVDLLVDRKLGRAQLPTNVLGLLFHAAEHATRHAGQAVTTAKVLSA